MDVGLLESTLLELDQPAYRAGQVWSWAGRYRRVRRDDRPPEGAARQADRACAVLDTLGRGQARSARRDDQGALPYRRRAPGRGCAHALPRRPALAVPLLAVRVPADVHVLCHRADDLRSELDRVGDPRPGAALPSSDGGRPRGVHGHGQADVQPRRGARRCAPPSGDRDHAPPNDDLDGRLAPRPEALRRRGGRADPPGAVTAPPTTICARRSCP